MRATGSAFGLSVLVDGALARADALPDKWADFVLINYAFPDPNNINALVDQYAAEHSVQNPPIEAR